MSKQAEKQYEKFSKICEGVFAEGSAYVNCLPFLLGVLNWPGNSRHFAEVLPHLHTTLTISNFLDIMTTLNFKTRRFFTNVKFLDERLFPCMFVSRKASPVILLDRQGETLKIFNGEENRVEEIVVSSQHGEVFLFDDSEVFKGKRKATWTSTLLDNHKSSLKQAMLISFLMNIMLLVVPLFIKAVYDKIVVAESILMLQQFAIGAVVALIGIFCMHKLRATVLLYVGYHLDMKIGMEIFKKILHLPPQYTENSSVASQMARIKDFDVMREFLTGPVLGLLFELPFVILFIIAISFFSLPLALVPLVAIALFFCLGALVLPKLNQLVNDSAEKNSSREMFLLETFEKLREVKKLGLREAWVARYRESSAKSAISNYYTSSLNNVVNIVADFFMFTSGVAIVIIGVNLVMHGELSMGALIASMILVWRVLTPIKVSFSTLIRFIQVNASLKQLATLMNVTTEVKSNVLIEPINDVQGLIKLKRVSMRYQANADPILVGVDFELKPGEMLAIMGGNGSGKTTLLKLLLGFYKPQLGQVYIDGIDISHVDRIEMRRQIAYVPQEIQFFYGSIAQNLRMVNPLATNKDLERATELAGVLDDILNLQEGFETRIGDNNQSTLTAGFRQRLSIARAYIKNSKIIILDEPGNGLDQTGDAQLIDAIQQLKSSRTVIMASHRPSHVKLSDKLLFLKEGRMKYFGATAETLPKVMKELM